MSISVDNGIPSLILEETDGSITTETSYTGIHPSPLSNQTQYQCNTLDVSDKKLELDTIESTADKPPMKPLRWDCDWETVPMNDMLWGYLNPGPQPPPNTARTLPQQGGIESGSTPSVPKAEKSSLSLTTYSNSAAGDFESQSQSTLRSVVSESKQEASPFEEIFTKARVTLNGKNTKVEYKHRRMPHKTSGLFLKSGRFNKNNLQNTILKMYYFDYEYRVPQPQWSVVLRQNKLSEKEFHELFKLFFEEEMDRFQSLADQIESPRSRKRRR